MSRTFVRQEQSAKTLVYDDSLAAGVALQDNSTDLEYDLNAMRSQMKRVSGEAKWYTALGGRDLKTTAIDLLDLENKKFLFRAQVLTDVTVTTAQNWEVLSVAASEAPSEVAAVGAGTANGALVALLPGDVGSHSLVEIAGQNALNPKNLCIVRDATTGDPILSGGKQVYALLQAETGVVDGEAFNDTTKQVQLSFVIENATADDLIACPVADIAGKTVNYSYVRRINLDSIPEQAFLTGAFVDQSSAVDVTLDNAVDNQSGPVTQTQSIDWRISDTYSLAFKTSDGLRTLMSIAPASGNDALSIDVDTLDINNTNSVDFSNGVIIDSTGTAITIGATAGVLSSAGKLDLSTASTFDLSLLAGGKLIFSDTYKAGSTFASPLQLSNGSPEWDAYEAAFGEVSLLNAITQAYTKAKFDKKVAALTANVNENVLVTGAGGTPNLDATLLDYDAKSFVDDVNVYLNGVLLRNGADAAANHDCYPSTVQAERQAGALYFEFKLKTGDQITMEVF